MKRQHEQKSKQWSDTARTRNEKKKKKTTGVEHMVVGSAHLPHWGQVKTISGDIRLVKELKGSVGNFTHLAKHHSRQLCVLWYPAFVWPGTRTRDGHAVTSEPFNGTGAAMARMLLRTLLILFTVMLVVTEAKKVRIILFFCYILFFLLFILVTWQKKDVCLFKGTGQAYLASFFFLLNSRRCSIPRFPIWHIWMHWW